MSEEIIPKTRTIIILFIGAIVMLLLSYACVLDWINKLKTGEDWLVNLIYHPLTGVLGIAFFTLAAIFGLEKATPGRIEKIRNYLEDNKRTNPIIFVITTVAFILLILNSIMLLAAGTTGVETLIAFHTLMGIIFGIGILMIILKLIINKYLSNRRKWERILELEVIICIVVFTIIVIVARAMGFISI